MDALATALPIPAKCRKEESAPALLLGEIVPAAKVNKEIGKSIVIRFIG